MPERFSILSRRTRQSLSAIVTFAAIVLAVGVAACSENLDGGLACPTLCPSQSNDFRDTIINAVIVDTSISGFPTFGLSGTLLVSTRNDTVQTSGVVRFDSLPTAFFPPGGTDTVSITDIDSVFLRVVVDSTGGRGLSQADLQVYDVDSAGLANPTPAQIRTLFRPDRLIGSAPLTPIAARDTIRIPLSKQVILAKITAHTRLRVGLRLKGTTSAQIRIVAFSGGAGSPLLAFDPSTDTAYAPVGVAPRTTLLGVNADEVLANTVYTVSDQQTADAGPQTLLVGGYPSRRSYLRFDIPSVINDSSTVVRAELLLTQQPSHGVDARDTIGVVPLVNTATTLVTDIRRAMDLSAEGFFAGLDSLLIVPGDSTVRTLNVLSVVRSWTGLPSNVARALVLRTSHEGAEPAEARFFSSEAPAGLGPRLRITYLPRVQGAIP
jgi:hypothetical protein